MQAPMRYRNRCSSNVEWLITEHRTRLSNIYNNIFQCNETQVATWTVTKNTPPQDIEDMHLVFTQPL